MLTLSNTNIKNIDNKQYEKIIYDNNKYNINLNKCLDIAFEFIIKNNLILYGGTAIDYALKSIGEEGIYRKKNLPDYDVYSSNFYETSIELANILYKKEFINISAINALHLSSRKVRYNFMEVMDISYIPDSIFNKLPYLVYNNIKIIHPDFIRLDMHRSLFNSYLNYPLDNFTHRAKKDITRFNLINTHFPIKSNYVVSNKSNTINIPITNLKNKCITGLLAFIIYINFYIEHVETTEKRNTKYDSNINIDNLKKYKIKSDKNNIIITIPSCCSNMKISLYDKNFIDNLKKLDSNENKKYYIKYLDNIKFRHVITDLYEFLDSSCNMLNAKNIKELATFKKIKWLENIKESDNIYLSCCHGVLQYFLCEYFMNKFNNNDIYKIYRYLYSETINITKYFNEYLVEPFILMSTYYGENDINQQFLYLDSKHNAILNKDKDYLNYLNTLLPEFGYYPENNKIPNIFIYEDSCFMKIDGTETKKKFKNLDNLDYCL